MFYYRKKQAVILEGQKFDSICEAAKYIGADPSCITWALRHNADRKYKNLSVRYADDSLEANAIANIGKVKEELKQKRSVQTKKSKMRALKISSKKFCPIYCETLNKTFKTLKAAAKFAKASTYSLSTKTEVAGQFVDKDGNVYKRLKPMNQRTNKKYTNTGDKLQYNRQAGYTRTVEHVAEPTKESVVKVKSGAELAKSLLIEKTIDYIQHNNFEVAKQLLDVVKEIKE